MRSEEEEEPPELENDIPPLSSLTSKDPSPLMYNNLVEILYSYVFTTRLYNGDYRYELETSVYVILQMSSVLNENRVYESCEAALLQALSNTHKVSFLMFTAYSVSQK